MAAYLTMVIIGRRSRSRGGTDEVQVTIRAIARPDEETATWLLREAYPSAEYVGIATPAAHGYRPITAASLAVTPVRRAARR